MTNTKHPAKVNAISQTSDWEEYPVQSDYRERPGGGRAALRAKGNGPMRVARTPENNRQVAANGEAASVISAACILHFAKYIERTFYVNLGGTAGVFIALVPV